MCDRCGARVSGRYCPECGHDQRPEMPATSVTEARLAQDRERSWLERNRAATVIKRCPECAESVQAAARVCRFCGYRFDGAAEAAGASAGGSNLAAGSARAPVPEKKPWVAGLLGLLIAGLGHLYVGEYGRAALIFASAVAAAIGMTVAGGGAALVGLAILIFSIWDARGGASHLNETKTTRPLAGPVWAVVAVGAIALTIGLVSASGSGSVDTAAVADRIRPDLESQLQDQVPDAAVTVDGVRCVSADSSGGTCLADVSDSLGNTSKLSITYTVDSGTGQVLWQSQP